MRVAHVIDSLHWGGAQKWIALFTEVARQRGVDVTIISLSPFTENNPYQNQLASFGANVVALSVARLYDFGAMPALTRTLRTHHFDVIQTHLSQSNILGTMAGNWIGIPVVATLHSTHLDIRGYHRARSLVEQIMLRHKAHRVIAVGNGVAEAHRARLGGKTIDIVANAVKPGIKLSDSERKSLRTDLSGDSNRNIIIAVGRMVALKGYAELLTTFSQTRISHPDIFLVIIGDGQLRSNLETQASSLGINDAIRFVGWRTDVPRLLAAADIFVNTSHWEGLSISMLEAMAAGLPILATSVGEAPVLLAEGRGLLVRPHSVDDLAVGLDALLSSLETRQQMGVAVRTFCELHYSLDPWLDKILNVYDNAQNAALGRKVSLA